MADPNANYSLDISERAAKTFFIRVMEKWEYDKLWGDTPS